MPRPALILALLLSLALASSRAAADDLPDTPAGRMLGRYLEAFNTGDPATLLSFLQQNYPVNNVLDHAVQIQILRDRTGGVDFLGMGKSTETDARARVRSRKSGDELVMIMLLEAAPPHDIRGIGVGKGPVALGVTPTETSR